jgi:hypothetical protein
MDALTDRDYWNAVWSRSDPHPRVARSDVPRLRIPDDALQTWLHRLFANHLLPGSRFLEVGAGGSPWPAEVARSFDCEAWGIDFSARGLALAQAAVDAAPPARPRGKSAAPPSRVRLVEGDFFDPALLPRGAFDLVYSGGFVEHFSDDTPMQRMAELLRTGGLVITTVPNLLGLNGLMQRLVDPACYRRHVRFSLAELDRRHQVAGLVPVFPARYFGVLDLGSVNFARLAHRLPSAVMRGLWLGMSTSHWIAERIAGSRERGGGRRFAPTLLGVYRRQPEHRSSGH